MSPVSIGVFIKHFFQLKKLIAGAARLPPLIINHHAAGVDSFVLKPGDELKILWGIISLVLVAVVDNHSRRYRPEILFPYGDVLKDPLPASQLPDVPLMQPAV